MRVVYGINSYEPQRESVVTTGMFDGVHFGHRKLLQSISRLSQHHSFESVVLTIWPHPRSSQTDFRVLTTLEEKIYLLENQGIDTLIVQSFDSWFSGLSPEQYIEQILYKILKARVVVQGYDHRFGHNRLGNLQSLLRHGQRFGYDLVQIEPQEIENIAISSTKIREALKTGNFLSATKYLAGAYPLTGKVGHGFKLGKTIGFPTANLTEIYAHKLLPKHGVYAAETHLNQTYPAVVNIGRRPTFEGENTTVEVHLIGFEGDLYDQELSVWLYDFLREEKKFDSIQQLSVQIKADCQRTLELHHTRQNTLDHKIAGEKL